MQNILPGTSCFPRATENAITTHETVSYRRVKTRESGGDQVSECSSNLYPRSVQFESPPRYVLSCLTFFMASPSLFMKNTGYYSEIGHKNPFLLTVYNHHHPVSLDVTSP